MGIPICFTVILGIVLIGNIISTYVRQQDQKKIDKFLDDYNSVKIVPHEKLKSIKFININLDNINPNSKNEIVMQKFEKLLKLNKAGMTNFESNMTNDQIKEKYGTNNFQEVLDYQNNYDNFLKVLVEISELLIEEENYKDASTFLELGITLDTDISKNYTLLADIYDMNNQRKKLFYLIDKVLNNNNLSQEKIMNYISSLNQKKKENI